MALASLARLERLQEAGERWRGRSLQRKRLPRRRRRRLRRATMHRRQGGLRAARVHWRSQKGNQAEGVVAIGQANNRPTASLTLNLLICSVA